MVFVENTKHLFLLGLEVVAVEFVGMHLDGHAFLDLEAELLELLDLVGVVRQKAHGLDA